jgi:uncharacterized protein (DUF433 family)
MTPDSLPFREEPVGVMRVGKTRVSLDTVVYAYRQGYSPEQIIEQYDALELADVYGGIAYYLRHRREVDQYLVEREAEAERLRAQAIEAGYSPRDPAALLRMLKERWAARECATK